MKTHIMFEGFLYFTLNYEVCIITVWKIDNVHTLWLKVLNSTNIIRECMYIRVKIGLKVRECMYIKVRLLLI